MASQVIELEEVTEFDLYIRGTMHTCTKPQTFGAQLLERACCLREPSIDVSAIVVWKEDEIVGHKLYCLCHLTVLEKRLQ